MNGSLGLPSKSIWSITIVPMPDLMAECFYRRPLFCKKLVDEAARLHFTESGRLNFLAATTPQYAIFAGTIINDNKVPFKKFYHTGSDIRLNSQYNLYVKTWHDFCL